MKTKQKSVEKMNPTELREERDQCHIDARKILDSSEESGKPLSADDQETIDLLLSRADDCHEAWVAYGVQNNLSFANQNGVQRFRDAYPQHSIPSEPLTNGRTYASMFGDATDSHGFRSAEEFLSVLSSGRYDERLAIGSVMSEGVASDGGFLVPPSFAATMLDGSLESEIVRPRCRVYPMKSNEMHIPGWDVSDNSSTLYGGFSGEWLAENSEATKSYPKVRQIVLHARKLALYTAASNEVVSDGVSFESQLMAALRDAIGYFFDTACLNGTGAGQPLGILNDPALISVAKETGQASETIVYKNLTQMYSRLHPSCLRNAVWICNSTTIPQLCELQIAVGTGGQHIPALNENSGKFTLLGHEVLFTEKLPSLGEEGDIVFCDLSQYCLGVRGDVRLEKSVSVGWVEDQSDYRCILRADGQGAWSSAVTPKNGDTLSWCVALAERG